MIYEVEYIRGTDRLSAYASTREELFNLIWIIDNAEYVKVWKISQFEPRDFGWAPKEDWNKCVDKFEQEHYHL